MNDIVYKWISVKDELPEIDGLYLITQKSPSGTGGHEMYFKTEDKKWYWQPNPYSVCGDGFIIEWLKEIKQPITNIIERVINKCDLLVKEIDVSKEMIYSHKVVATKSFNAMKQYLQSLNEGVEPPTNKTIEEAAENYKNTVLAPYGRRYKEAGYKDFIAGANWAKENFQSLK